MDTFGALPVFIAVVENGGFSPAAEQLGISKSAVSKRITQLEADFGVKLFSRTTRKISLTEAGEHYYAHAVVAFNAAKDAEDSVAQLQGEPQGTLRINTPMSFGHLHIAPLIPDFLKRFPKIRIDMVMDDKVVDLVGGGFDLAIRGSDLEDSNLVARRLAPLNNSLCASPEYLAEHGTPLSPTQLSEHNCLAFSYSKDDIEWHFTQDSQLYSVEVRGNYQVNNSEALRLAILSGLGIGRLPTFIAGPDIKSGRLIQLLPAYEMPGKSLYAVYPERQYLPAKVRVFLDYLIEKLGTTPPYWEV